MAFIKGGVIPERILRLIPAAERAKLGKAGQNAEETLAKAAIKNERDLQNQIVAFLRMHEIKPIVSRMDKRTSNNVGTPDILFCVFGAARRYEDHGDQGHSEWDEKVPVGFAWECKFSDGKSSDAQKEMASKMTQEPNAWRHRVIKSLDEAIAELRAVGFLT